MKLPRLQFRLHSLLALMAIAACGLAIFVRYHQIRQREKAALEFLDSAGVIVGTDVWTPDPAKITLEFNPDLFNFSRYDELAPHLRNCPPIWDLGISSGSNTERFSVDFYRHISEMPRVERVMIFDDQITVAELSAISKLHGLKTLSIPTLNAETSPLVVLRDCEELTELDCSINGTNVEIDGQPTRLKSLRLYGNHLKDVSISNLGCLEMLDIRCPSDNTNLKIANLAQLTSLKISTSQGSCFTALNLALSRCQQLTSFEVSGRLPESFWPQLSALRKLTDLKLKRECVNDTLSDAAWKTIASMPKLTTLCLYRIADDVENDTMPNYLAKMPHLKELTISVPPYQEHHFDKLRQLRPDLLIINK